MDYIRIAEWDKIQHYKQRNPPWVKLYSWILDDDSFDCLPDDSKLLFFCLLPFASRRKNQIRLDFKWLQKKLPIERKITNDTIQPLVTAGFIECYHDDSKAIADDKQDAIPETETETETETEKRQKRAESDGDFDIFWKAYPKKRSKDAALRRWNSIKPDAGLLQTILAAIEQQKKSENWRKDGGQFIPYPATWLNAGAWKDEMSRPQRKVTAQEQLEAYENAKGGSPEFCREQYEAEMARLAADG